MQVKLEVIRVQHRLNYNAATSAPTKYTDHQVATEIEGSLTKKISLESQFSFRHNGRLPAGSDNRQMWLWNLNASMKVFRNEKGQITLSAMDLLNQNADINRIIGDHFMEPAF